MTQIEELQRNLRDARETIKELNFIINEMKSRNLLRVIKNVCRVCGRDKTDEGCPHCLKKILHKTRLQLKNTVLL